MDKRFSIIIATLLIGFGGIFFLTKNNNQSDNSNSQNSKASKVTIEPTKFTVGAGNKKVTLIEYGDLQCPACGQYYPLVKQVKAKYGDDITFQFRHFPLVQIHKSAMIAHRAAQAAGNQGKFFEMHDMMYEQQQSWTNSSNSSEIFEGYAQQIGLDMERYKADTGSRATNDIINLDITEGQKIGANSTPTFVINGKKIENPRDLDGFYKLIDEAIKAANPQ